MASPGGAQQANRPRVTALHVSALTIVVLAGACAMVALVAARHLNSAARWQYPAQLDRRRFHRMDGSGRALRQSMANSRRTVSSRRANRWQVLVPPDAPPWDQPSGGAFACERAHDSADCMKRPLSSK